jgi:hypothetical protein
MYCRRGLIRLAKASRMLGSFLTGRPQTLHWCTWRDGHWVFPA